MDAEAVVGPTLPDGVYLSRGKYGLYFNRGGKRYQSPLSLDLDVLQRWRVEKERELDAAGVPATRRHKRRERAEHQSAVRGVRWNSRDKKWIGACVDRLLSAKNAKTTYLCTPCFADEFEVSPRRDAQGR